LTVCDPGRTTGRGPPVASGSVQIRQGIAEEHSLRTLQSGLGGVRRCIYAASTHDPSFSFAGLYSTPQNPGAPTTTPSYATNAIADAGSGQRRSHRIASACRRGESQAQPERQNGGLFIPWI